MMPYASPQPCPGCGEPVVHDFGVFNADAYEYDVLTLHVCLDWHLTTHPLNERDFLDASDEQLEMWGTRRIPEPEPGKETKISQAKVPPPQPKAKHKGGVK